MDLQPIFLTIRQCILHSIVVNVSPKNKGALLGKHHFDQRGADSSSNFQEGINVTEVLDEGIGEPFRGGKDDR
jgi:hypothetical protein